jgi:hypothetical protein
MYLNVWCLKNAYHILAYVLILPIGFDGMENNSILKAVADL